MTDTVESVDDVGEGGAPTDNAAELANLPRNDFGLGERLIKRFGKMIAHTPEVGWAGWDGKVWATDHRGEAAVRKFAHQTAKMVRIEEVQALTEQLGKRFEAEERDPDKRERRVEEALKGFVKFATEAGNAGKTSAMMSQAQPYLTTELATFDPDKFRLTVQNGTLDFQFIDTHCIVARDADGVPIDYTAVKAWEMYDAGKILEVGGIGVRPDAAGYWEVDGRAHADADMRAGVEERGVWLTLQHYHLIPTLGPHDPAHRITRMAGAKWNPKAKAKLWLQHLSEVLPDAREREFFQRAMGYAMTGDISSQCFLFIQGKGADGKSTTIRAILHTLGTYARTCDPKSWLLMKQRSAADASPDMAAMAGDTRFLYCEEPEKNARLNEALVKHASGGLPLPARHLNAALFEFLPRFLLTMAFNDLVRISGGDDGFWRRMRFILFPVQFTPAQQLANADRYERLVAEAEGILNWLIEGMGRWRKYGLHRPDWMEERVNNWRAAANPFSDWFMSNVEKEPKAKILNSLLYKDYKDFCDEQGYAGHDVLGSKGFANQLDSLQIKMSKINGNRFRVGVKLASKDEPFSTRPPTDEGGGG